MTADAKPYTREPLRPAVKALFDGVLAARPPERVIEATAMRLYDIPAAAYFNIGAPVLPVEREIMMGDIRALVWTPREPSDVALPVLLHMHGGGFVIYTAEFGAKPMKKLALAADAVVVSIDYRRAPEHKYPEPLDDCVAAFRWLHQNAASLGGDPARIALSGDSAGGNLAAATALRLQAEGDDALAVLLLCAWTDLANNTPSFRAFGPDDPLIDDLMMNYWRDCYAPREEQQADPFASPLRADLSSFPPACVVVGGIDPLRDDGILFAEKLGKAGRQVELQLYEGMPHDFMIFPQLEHETDVIDRIAAFLRKTLHPAEAPNAVG